MFIPVYVISNCMDVFVLVCFSTALVRCKNNLSIPWSHWLHHYTILFIIYMNELRKYFN